MHTIHRAAQTSRQPFSTVRQTPPAPQQASHLRHAPACSALPSIRDFIRQECPLPGTDGFGYRERPMEASLVASCIALHRDALVVPGQRRIFSVNEAQLEQIIKDQGQVLLCCFEDKSASKLLAPRRGSYSCLASVAGLQRLPGTGQALVRIAVTDRVAVQAIDNSKPAYIRAQSALLKDRWTYMVKTEALQQYGSTGSSSSGPEVVHAVEQVQDAVTELQQLLQQLADTVQAVVDSPQQSQLQQALTQYEASDELSDILAWCSEVNSCGGSQATPTTNTSSSSILIETAWRLSFASFAAVGVTNALLQCSALSSSSSSSSSKLSKAVDQGAADVLEMTDLGLRLEESLELAALLQSGLSLQLALGQ